MRDAIIDGQLAFGSLDAAQLVKHAFGLRTQAAAGGKKAALIYLYAEPGAFPDRRPVDSETINAHRKEVRIFSDAVSTAPSDIAFEALRYEDLLVNWENYEDSGVRAHSAALRKIFDI